MIRRGLQGARRASSFRSGAEPSGSARAGRTPGAGAAGIEPITTEKQALFQSVRAGAGPIAVPAYRTMPTGPNPL